MTYSTDKKQYTQNTKMMGLNAHTGLRAGFGFDDVSSSWNNFVNNLKSYFATNNTTPEQQSPSSSDTSKTQS